MTPPVLFLHPFPFDSGFWAPVVARMRDAPTGVLDAPGFGGRPMPVGWSIADWAEDAAERIAAGPSGTAVVCGLSMGGYAALALAAGHPSVLAGLVLADTKAGADDEKARAGRDAGIEKVTGGEMAAWLDDLMPKLVSPAAGDDVRADLRAQAARQDPSCVAEALRALRDRPDRTGDLARIAVPTLVVVGEDDGVTPPAAARALHDGIDGSRLETIPGAGHLSAAERPDEFASLVAEFAEGIG
ncbi:MAG: alpha/beta fold hydrolase [Thermoleophilia bacterium]|nr:alpha/beta fold hydrolase [Thermoleophilia bacterium]